MRKASSKDKPTTVATLWRSAAAPPAACSSADWQAAVWDVSSGRLVQSFDVPQGVVADNAALALEKGLNIAYLGPEATWTHQAARAKFGASVDYSSQANIGDVFDQVARRRADYGVVPIENSVEGAVNHTLDLFMDSELKICAQILLRIENNLLSNEPKEKIAKIYSHPQVFGQCRHWLKENAHELEWIEVSSTTKAAEQAAREPGAATLAGALDVAGNLRAVPGRVLTTASEVAFVNGVHMAVTGGAFLVCLSAIAVARWLPRDLTHEGVDVAVVEEFV